MPLLQPYQGDLEQYNPRAKTDIDLRAIMDTFLKSRALKENKFKEQRDQQILDAVIAGEEIPGRTPQEAPQGLLQSAASMFSGGTPHVGPSKLETSMAELALKNQFLSPLEKLIQQGQAADAQMKIYDAGGPQPDLYGEPAVQEPTLTRLPNIAPGAPVQVNGRPVVDVNVPTEIEYDAFGRQKSKKVDILGREKFSAEQQEKAEATEKQTQHVKDAAQRTVDTITEIKKGIKYFGAAGNAPAWPAEYKKQNWIANVDRLRGRLVLDLMNEMKQASKTGATGFGQLSNKELKILQDSATALKKGLSEEDAARYLQIIEESASKIIGDGKKTKPNNKTESPYSHLWE